REREGDIAVVDAEFTLDDDGFMTPPPKSASGQTHNAIFGEGDETGGSDDGFASAQAALQEPAERKRAIWLEPEAPAAAAPVEELPPIQREEPAVATEEAAGQGLGYDYAFSPAQDGGDRPIPRISVHAFCTRTPSLGLMRTIM